MRGALLVAGTSSDAGKSLFTAGLCRLLARRGISVAPFKAQNMSNNSAVTADGGEIGRAQALQAQACGIEPSVLMNPVLLKPGSDRRSHVLLHGRPYAEAGALDYRQLAATLRKEVLASFDELRRRHDVVVCEGAGSPTEINLRETDLANLWLADQRDLPTVVVGDIDRGGVFAAFYGTLALLGERDQSLVVGFVVNKFRGDPHLLAPGLDMLTALTGRPVYGVLPWLADLRLAAEDSLSTPPALDGGGPVGAQRLSVAAVRLPRTSNSTDVDALGAEPGVTVRWTTSPAEVAAADLAVLPGSRATVADLDWLRGCGLAAALTERARTGRPLLGICGGYQMLAHTIDDEVESGAGTVRGLALLPVTVRFGAEKILSRPTGTAYGAEVSTGYEIHHGITMPLPAGPEPCEPFLDGCRLGAVWGTMWHGAFDSDDFRRAFLRQVAEFAGRDFTPAPDTDIAANRTRQLDRLADALEAGLDLDALTALIGSGPPAGLPVLPPAALRPPGGAVPADLRHHGDAELTGDLHDFAVNVCTDPAPAWLAEAIAAACGQLARYPRPGAAIAAAAARHRRPVAEVLLTAGAAEAFTLLAQGIPAGRAAVVHPQFTEPEVVLRAAGWQVDRVLTDPDDGWALRPDRVPDSARLVVVGNPTNPTGTLHPRQALLALRRPGRLVVVDEAFSDAVPGEPESLASIEDLTGVVVVRSLTKLW
ncbi:cobyric acid synthase, partial [Jatrophihabitans sp.]|uniref:cobyric acid synthase n=1 Tax=Jatrophihabitans sp. TaxID=1932789 RepID=UPI002C355647|nr:cobyric acid synthase [Jatrophihabitans sp.]